jgi:septal ring factor EnvC (AmiA/AmiB activator)
MKTHIRLAIGLLTMFLVTGCDNEISFRTRTEDTPPADDVQVYGPSNDSLQMASTDRYDDLSEGGTLNDAVSTHQRYIDLLEEHNKLLKAHKDLTHASRDQQEKLAALEKENAQLTKELNDATEMLTIMQRELDKWKNDIFVYRQELNTALQNNRRLMERIIRILGGEMPQIEPANQETAAKPDANS